MSPIAQVPGFIEHPAYWTFGILDALVVGCIATLSVRTSLLRDAVPTQPIFTLRPYSLAKTQLAFWTAIVVSAYLFIYILTDIRTDMPNATALALLGISMGTTALASPGGPAAQPTAAPAPPQPAVAATAPQAHVSFIADILSDNQGMNFHRLQMVLWTLVFGGIFAYESFTSRKLPTLSPETFALMGMSSTTYVWLRRAET